MEPETHADCQQRSASSTPNERVAKEDAPTPEKLESNAMLTVFAMFVVIGFPAIAFISHGKIFEILALVFVVAVIVFVAGLAALASVGLALVRHSLTMASKFAAELPSKICGSRANLAAVPSGPALRLRGRSASPVRRKNVAKKAASAPETLESNGFKTTTQSNVDQRTAPPQTCAPRRGNDAFGVITMLVVAGVAALVFMIQGPVLDKLVLVLAGIVMFVVACLIARVCFSHRLFLDILAPGSNLLTEKPWKIGGSCMGLAAVLAGAVFGQRYITKKRSAKVA